MVDKFTEHQHVLLASIAAARGFSCDQTEDNLVLETEDFSTSDHNAIAKTLLGQTASLEDLASVETILNYIKKLPNYQRLVAEAKAHLIDAGFTVPEPNVIETFQPGTIGWMRQLIDMCK